MKKVVIAGGTGTIGRVLENELASSGYDVKILSRNPRKENHVYWSPAEGLLEMDQIADADVIINLCGEGVADKQWTAARKRVLIDSRVEPAKCLYARREQFTNLSHYLSASGLNTYGYTDKKDGSAYVETDPFGADTLSQIVKVWEEGADLFSKDTAVTKLRIPMVLSKTGGALEKLSKSVKMGFGAALGSGEQEMQWIHVDDLAKLFKFAIENKLIGTYNVHANTISNKEFTRVLAMQYDRKVWMPNVPEFMMKLYLGTMSEMLLKGVPVSNEKLRATGFQFNYDTLDKALKDLV